MSFSFFYYFPQLCCALLRFWESRFLILGVLIICLHRTINNTILETTRQTKGTSFEGSPFVWFVLFACFCWLFFVLLSVCFCCLLNKKEKENKTKNKQKTNKNKKYNSKNKHQNSKEKKIPFGEAVWGPNEILVNLCRALWLGELL